MVILLGVLLIELLRIQMVILLGVLLMELLRIQMVILLGVLLGILFLRLLVMLLGMLLGKLFLRLLVMLLWIFFECSKKKKTRLTILCTELVSGSVSLYTCRDSYEWGGVKGG